MENLKKLLLQNVTYEQMNKINLATAFVRPTILLANSITALTGNFLYELFIPLFILNEAAMGLTNFKNGHFTKENYEIYKIYKEVLDNYNKLNKIFNLSNPVELSMLLNYAIYNGYLSKDKTFSFSKEKVNDIHGIKGANILAGNAVCRHISKFYKDVLDLNNFSNDLIFVSRDESKDIAHVKETLETLQRCGGVESEIIEPVVRQLQELEENNNFQLNTPTHCINFVTDKKNSYFIDVTNESLLYKFNDDKNTLFYKYYDNIKIFYKKCKEYSDDKSRKFNKTKYLPGMENEAYEELNKRVIRYIDDNKDILEKFYHENKDAYEQVHELIKK